MSFLTEHLIWKLLMAVLGAWVLHDLIRGRKSYVKLIQPLQIAAIVVVFFNEPYTKTIALSLLALAAIMCMVLVVFRHQHSTMLKLLNVFICLPVAASVIFSLNHLPYAGYIHLFMFITPIAFVLRVIFSRRLTNNELSMLSVFVAHACINLLFWFLAN